MDKIDKERRSENMRAIRSKNTVPELIVRRLVRSLGVGYRLHYPLPGKPDLTFIGRKKVIFVHGCFWHKHECPSVRVPKSNQTYWEPKLSRTRERDAATADKLSALGWSVLTIWECELKNESDLRARLQDFLMPEKTPSSSQ